MTTWLVASCHGDSAPAPVAKPAAGASVAAVSKQGQTPEELTQGMVEAVTIGKSSVPVSLKFDLGERPVVGRALPIVVAVLPMEPARGATLKVTGSAGLQVPAAAAIIDLPAMDPNQVYKVSIGITPTAEGVQLLGLNLTLQHDEGGETRSFSVPVIVAPAVEAGNSDGTRQ